MKISEVFATVQGEGLLAGVPSLFIRVSGCNLRCVWCDTPYTSWQPEGEVKSVEELVEWTAEFPLYKHAVLTGGEPMIFPETVELTHRLRDRGMHITVETAGTVYQPVACDLMSISPKLANSAPWDREPRWAVRHEELRIQWDVLQRLVKEYECQLKFVVAEPGDLAEVEGIVTRLSVEPRRVLLMPEGVEASALDARSRWLVEICKETGYRFCPRLHILIWGHRRGV